MRFFLKRPCFCVPWLISPGHFISIFFPYAFYLQPTRFFPIIFILYVVYFSERNFIKCQNFILLLNIHSYVHFITLHLCNFNKLLLLSKFLWNFFVNKKGKFYDFRAFRSFFSCCWFPFTWYNKLYFWIQSQETFWTPNWNTPILH